MTRIPSPTAGAHLETEGCVVVRGAREHNLKDVDVAIPRDALVVLAAQRLAEGVLVRVSTL